MDSRNRLIDREIIRVSYRYYEESWEDHGVDGVRWRCGWWLVLHPGAKPLQGTSRSAMLLLNSLTDHCIDTDLYKVVLLHFITDSNYAIIIKVKW